MGSSKQKLIELLATLRVGYLLYQNAHWNAQGDAFAGQHKMFQEFYEETLKQLDELAEKILGYFGPNSIIELQLQELVYAELKEYPSGQDYVIDGLSYEIRLQKKIKDTYDILKEQMRFMPLGLDDFLMELASERDKLVYKLNQSGSMENKMSEKYAGMSTVQLMADNNPESELDSEELTAERTPEVPGAPRNVTLGANVDDETARTIKQVAKETGVAVGTLLNQMIEKALK